MRNMKDRLPKEENYEYNPYLKDIIIGAVENQLSENNPPITGETYKRLISLGYTGTQSKEKIATVLLEHIYYTMKDNKPFDEKLYTKQLKELK